MKDVQVIGELFVRDKEGHIGVLALFGPEDRVGIPPGTVTIAPSPIWKKMAWPFPATEPRSVQAYSLSGFSFATASAAIAARAGDPVPDLPVRDAGEIRSPLPQGSVM
jgi:hypothetical protein